MADLVALAALAVAAWQGWRRGSLLMLLGIASLAAGYVGAALLFRPAGRQLGAWFNLSPLVAMPLAATLVMALITGSLRLATFTVQQRRLAASQAGRAPSRLDSAGGAAIGAAEAAVYALLAAWVVMTLHTVAHAGPDISGSVTGRAATAVMKRATYAVTSRLTNDPLVATMMSVVATHPAEGVQAANTLLRNPRVTGLFTNAALRSALARGDTAALAANPAVRSLSADRQFLAAASQLGIAPGQPGSDALARSLAQRVAPLARAAQSLSKDGDVRKLLENREFQRLVQQGNFAALMNNPQFKQLAGRLLENLRQDNAATP